MELVIAIAIGLMTTSGVFLILRRRTFPVIVGLSMLTYAVNAFLFVSGKLVINAAPVLGLSDATPSDPLPQALVLTAIVISFGMTAVILMMALGAYIHTGDDRIEGDGDPAREEPR